MFNNFDWATNLTKGAAKFAEIAANPKTYKNLEHLVNTGGEALQGGYQSLVKEPNTGWITAALGETARQSINKINSALGNPLTPEQQQNQLQFLRDTQTSLDVSRAISQGRNEAEKTGNIYDTRESALNQIVNLPMYLQQAVSFAGEGITGGLGSDWDKSWEEKGYKKYYDTFERENKNKLFFGSIPFIPGESQKPKKGKEILSQMSSDIVQRLPDEVFLDIWNGNVNSKYNLSDEFEKATKTYETDNIVIPLLQEKVRNGDLSTEKVNQALDEHLSNQALRDFTAEAATDPLTWVDPFAALGGVGKNILKATGVPNVKNIKNLPKVLGGSKSAEVLTGKLTSKIDESEKLVQNIDNIIKQAETPQIKEAGKVSEGISSKPKLTENQFNTQKQQIIDNSNIQFEEKQQLLKQLAANTEFKKAAPKINDINNQAAKQQVRDIQQAMPAMDNKDTADIMLNQSRQAVQKEADELANGIWKKIKQYGGSDVVDTPLTVTYTPPNVMTNVNNVLQATNQTIPPIQLQFRNQLQKLFYELSVPYNKAIIEGYGMDFAKSKSIISNIVKNFAEPLTKQIYGNFDPKNVNDVKRVLGAVGSNLAKAATKHQPGTPLIFDNLKSAEMLDNLLLHANKTPSVKKSVLGAIKELPNTKITAPKVTAEAAESEIMKGYNDISNYFKGIGIPEDLAKKSAVFYNRAIERTGLSGAGGITRGVDEGITAGKAYNVDVLNDLKGLDRSIATELHEDFHQIFDYMRQGVDEPWKVQSVIKDAILKDIPDVGRKYYNQITKALNSIGTDRAVLTDEIMSYFVQTKKELAKGLFTENPVSRIFTNIFRKASNGDEGAKMLLDNLEGVEQAVRQHGDEFEQGLINQLKQTTLPDGSNAWNTVNRVDPSKMKSFYPGEKYGPGRLSLGENQAFLEDSTRRMNRLQELMGSQKVVYRGAKNKPSTGKVRTNYNSEDQLYGAGSYTSTNPAQAFPYSGVGELTDDIVKKWNPGTADVRAYYPSLERPLFWDELIPQDIIQTMSKSKNKYIKKAYDYLESDLLSGKTMENFPMDLHIVLEDVIGLPKEKAGKLILNEVWKKAGYDGFIGPNTETLQGFGKSGLEVVSFEGHNLFERTKELRELGKNANKLSKQTILTPKRLPYDERPQDIESLIRDINNTQINAPSAINYHINRGIE